MSWNTRTAIFCAILALGPIRWAVGGAAVVAVALLAFAGLAPTAAAETCGDLLNPCGPDMRRYEVAVRCNAAVVEDAETSDTLTVTLWHGYEYLGMHPIKGVICSRWYDPNRENAYFVLGDFNKRPTRIILETNGSDAFFADWIVVSEIQLDKYGAPMPNVQIAQFGAPGGRGYCLSRDPNDHSGAWAEASDACNPAIELNLTHNKVHAAMPTGYGLWLIGLDCVHSGLPMTLPWATISIVVVDSTGQVVAERTRDHYLGEPEEKDQQKRLADALTCHVDESNWGDPRSQVFGLGEFEAADVAAIEIRVGALDQTAWLDAKPEHSRFFIDQLVAVRNYADVARWGINEREGWCLSRYRESWTGNWRPFAPDGCLPGVRFEVGDQSWTPLPPN